MHFDKYNGLGNDFIFLDGNTARAVQNPSSLAKELCHRRLGIGADGLVLLLPSQTADIKMRIFNADGSEAEMCGNASRCVPLHLRRTGQTTKKNITLETLAGLIHTKVVDVDQNLVRVNMGAPRSCNIKRVELNGQGFEGTAVSMGNPHFVIFTNDISQIDVATLGPQLETHPAFPQKTNVEFVQVLSRDRVRMRVWERGSGETLACGTGACAALAVACVTGRCGMSADIEQLGGTLRVTWESDGHIYQEGPAEFVFDGEWLDNE